MFCGLSPSAGATHMVCLKLSRFSTHIMQACGAHVFRNHCADNEVSVGLIMQYHYVGLDKIPEQPQPTSQHSQKLLHQ